MFKEIRKYAVKLSETSPEHQIRIVELLEKVGEKVHHATRVREEKGGDPNCYFLYNDSKEWCVSITILSYPTTAIKSTEFLSRLESHLQETSRPTSDIEVGAVYLNTNGMKCTIESTIGGKVIYRHQNGSQYSTAATNIKSKWKFKEIKKDSNSFKYKPGDRVKVRTDLSEARYYKMFNSARVNTVTKTMLKYAGQIVTIDHVSYGNYRLQNITNNWTDEMFEGLAEEGVASEVPKYLDRPAQVADYVERVRGVEDFLQEFDSTINKVVNLSPTGLLTLKKGKGFYIKENFKVLNPLHPDYMTKDVVEEVETEQSLIEEIKINQKSENTKMATNKTLKETAVTTVEQNKEALIIASKMEAGKILTKQVLKQVKPHVPMLLRGYLDTPLAPVILANAIAILGNHTENKRVQQVAELMLLSAASETVGAFNLDKIIDDILSGVKLPAGVLEENDE